MGKLSCIHIMENFQPKLSARHIMYGKTLMYTYNVCVYTHTKGSSAGYMYTHTLYVYTYIICIHIHYMYTHTLMCGQGTTEYVWWCGMYDDVT